ncbi:DUF3179 domain-containing protein [Nitratireductor luteus]|uniref:DUF3179 domain-containing protein n=1 Tax=Nitratireductor luteus TaxID=2976980 RepID=UPI002240D53D|nr:DUF3179 domain-containing protein [Nitratireductor luteus]
MRPLIVAILLTVAASTHTMAGPERWRSAGWQTDFNRTVIDLAEVISGGPPRDGIPSINSPVFETASDVGNLEPNEPVIRLELDGIARAYPLRILIWHEIANDIIEGVPVAVTYCPLCNSSVVFNRRLSDGSVAEFGVSGLLRNSDMIMYDRATHSWWQQFTGRGIVGKYAGEELKMLPSRVESFAHFLADFPDGDVLVPNDPSLRPYGRNPYIGYDRRNAPYPLYTGELPSEIAPMARVIVVQEDNQVVAVALSHLRRQGVIEIRDVKLTWRDGMSSALDAAEVAGGADIGAVQAQNIDDGKPLVHDITFAFVVYAFHPDASVLTEKGLIKLNGE